MKANLKIGTLLHIPELNRGDLEFLKSAGMETCQLSRVDDDWMCGAAGKKRSAAAFELLAECGIDCQTLFLKMAPGTTGDGLATENARTARMVSACRQMLWAKAHGIPYITAHVGALSEIPCGAPHERLVADFRQLAHFAEENGQYFLLETGPECVAFLKNFFAEVDSPALGLNFDPANFLIYGTDKPERALEQLADRVKVVHCKDAVPARPGDIYGRETVLGQGTTDFVHLLPRLIEKGFRGPLIIERELPPGPEQRRDVAAAIKLLRQLRAEGGF